MLLNRLSTIRANRLTLISARLSDKTATAPCFDSIWFGAFRNESTGGPTRTMEIYSNAPPECEAGVTEGEQLRRLRATEPGGATFTLRQGGRGEQRHYGENRPA